MAACRMRRRTGGASVPDGWGWPWKGPGRRSASSGMLQRSERDEQPGCPLDFFLRGQEELFERRRIRHRGIESADDPDGSVEMLEGLLLEDRREALADAAGARVFVHDQDPVAVPRDGQKRVSIQRYQAAQVENASLDSVSGELL